MIFALMLALAYWILGVLFAICGCTALGCVVSLFLRVLYSFKSATYLMAVPLLIVFSFASLGACWLIQWIYIMLGAHNGQQMQFWFIVGVVVPGILAIGLVPKLVGWASGINKNRAVTPVSPSSSAKV